MQLSHTFEVLLPVEDAWTVLTDVERVGPCLPGATIEEAAGEEFRGLVKVKVGPITAEYRGEGRFLTLDRDAGRAVLEARGTETRGKGGAAAEVTLTLADSGAGTRVDVATDLSISGRLAQFGRGVIGEVADRLMGQFVANLEAQVGGHGPTAAVPRTNDAAGQTDPVADRPAAERRPVVDLATVAWPDEEELTPSDEPGPAEPACAAGPAPGADTEGAQLLSVVAVPVLKRLAPVVGAAGVVSLGWWVWWRHRR